MPTTPDRPDGRPAGSEDQLEAAEAVHLAARETAPVDVRQSAPERREIRRARPDPAGGRPTVKIDAGGRETVKIDQDALGRRETVKLPGRRKPADDRGRAPLAVAAAFAALWAALVSYLPVTAVIGLARTLEGAGGLAGAAHAGLAGWLLGHGVPIGTSIGPLALAPLLLTLLAIWRLNRAGLHVTR
ncbi:MAG: hypothetical protein QOC94_745, partial [Actinoplanes sp.]|nr:hypothetical protein [Actinoplanes sp.]